MNLKTITMQINRLDPRIKGLFKCLGWPLLFIALWFNGCSGNEKSETITKVTVPAVVGKFESKKPDHTPAEWPKKDQEKPIIKWKDKEIRIENPVNTELVQQYVKAKDSIERLNLYLKSIELKRFSSKFEDENLLLDINGIVQGEVQEITPTYTIKAKEIPIQIKQKENIFRLLCGIEVGNSKTLDSPSLKGSVMFQNKKGSVISASYGTDQKIWIGYHVSIFSLRK